MVKLQENINRIKSIMIQEQENGIAKLNLNTNYENVELVPVTELIKFREFDRRKHPKWGKEDSDNTINNLKHEFITNGITTPLIIDYNQYDNRILLVEGCHRLNAAIELGIQYLPCRVIRIKKDFPKGIIHKTMKVPGIKPDAYGYVPADLSPSQIGIPGTKPLSNNLY